MKLGVAFVVNETTTTKKAHKTEALGYWWIRSRRMWSRNPVVCVKDHSGPPIFGAPRDQPLAETFEEPSLS